MNRFDPTGLACRLNALGALGCNLHGKNPCYTCGVWCAVVKRDGVAEKASRWRVIPEHFRLAWLAAEGQYN